MVRRAVVVARRAGVVGALVLLGAVGLWASPVFGQSAAAPVITSVGPFMVDEGTIAVATLAATDSDTLAADLTWTMAGGADAALLVLSESGVLAFGSVKDFEEPDDGDGDGTYEVTVQVSDGVSDVAADVLVMVGNVVELEAIAGPEAVTFAENSWSRVATFSASSAQDRDAIVWTLGGSDAAHFSIGDPPGVLRFDLVRVAPAIFSKPPDFEAPVDSVADNTDNTYVVTLLPRAGSVTADSPLTVTVAVTDADEDGTCVAVDEAAPHRRGGHRGAGRSRHCGGRLADVEVGASGRAVRVGGDRGGGLCDLYAGGGGCGEVPAGQRDLQRQARRRRASRGDRARGGGGRSAEQPVDQHQRLRRQRRVAPDAARLRRGDPALLRGLQQHRHDDPDDAPR